VKCWVTGPKLTRRAGELQSVDGYMNIALEKCEEHVNGVKKRSYGDAFIRGNNGIHPSPPLQIPSSPVPTAIDGGADGVCVSSDVYLRRLDNGSPDDEEQDGKAYEEFRRHSIGTGRADSKMKPAFISTSSRAAIALEPQM